MLAGSEVNKELTSKSGGARRSRGRDLLTVACYIEAAGLRVELTPRHRSPPFTCYTSSNCRNRRKNGSLDVGPHDLGMSLTLPPICPLSLAAHAQSPADLYAFAAAMPAVARPSAAAGPRAVGNAGRRVNLLLEGGDRSDSLRSGPSVYLHQLPDLHDGHQDYQRGVCERERTMQRVRLSLSFG